MSDTGRDLPTGADIPDRVIERLSTYRRFLRPHLEDGNERVFSHELAALEGVTAAQVRRDLMTIGYSGSPSRGYDVAGLIAHITSLLNPAGGGGLVLVGMGHIGGAVADYFSGRHPEHSIVAAFDVHPDRVGKTLHHCRCYHVDELESALEGLSVLVGIIAVPSEAAQDVCDRLVRVGVRGILNFAPVRLNTPGDIYVENVDIAVSLEKVVFFAMARTQRAESV